MNNRVISLAVGLALLPAGCTMAPKYVQPKAPVPSNWPTGDAYAEKTPAAAPQARNLRWEEFFVDEKLRKLIDLALRNNRDLRIAALNAELSRALYGIQRAELFPALTGSATASKELQPADLSGNGKTSHPTRYGVNLGVVAWEIDFFGRIRSLKDQALFEYLATEEGRRSAQILLVSSVANAYLALAADREGLSIAQTTLAAQQHTYNIVKSRNNLGLVPDLDVRRAQTQVDSARVSIAAFTQLVAQDINALDLLLGAPAPRELLPLGFASVVPPRPIAAGLPSEVLLQRPDVLQAEDQLKAANANVGAARAALFPRISLTTAIGTASSQLSGLFKAGAGVWSYAPEIVMPIFDARVWSALSASKVQQQLVVSQYERAIQISFREVSDALAVHGTVGQQMTAQQSLVDAVAETYRLSTSRYDKGIDSYLSVLDAQRSLFDAQQALVSVRLAKLANDVRLYSVLGGGWQDPVPAVAPAPAAAPAQAAAKK